MLTLGLFGFESFRFTRLALETTLTADSFASQMSFVDHFHVASGGRRRTFGSGHFSSE